MFQTNKNNPQPFHDKQTTAYTERLTNSINTWGKHYFTEETYVNDNTMTAANDDVQQWIKKRHQALQMKLDKHAYQILCTTLYVL